VRQIRARLIIEQGNHKDWETFLFKDGLMVTTNSQIKWGWSEQAELWNGRLAMLGFVIAIATEFLTGVGVLGQLRGLLPH
jgi:hypothetical protein